MSRFAILEVWLSSKFFDGKFYNQNTFDELRKTFDKFTRMEFFFETFFL